MPTKITREEYERKFGKAPVPVSSPAPVASSTGPVKISRAEYEAKFGRAPEPVQPEKKDGFFKSLVKAPATIVARPFQLAAEAIMPGDNTEAIDRFSKEKLKGFVAPVPQNVADVKKDVGRAAQTVAYGMPGLASGGAVFGAGSSLEKGNDLLSTETAVETAIGAGGAKLAGLALDPLFKGASKVISKSPAGKAAIEKGSQMLAGAGDDAISKAAVTTESVINKPFEIAGKGAKTVLPKPNKIVGNIADISSTDAAKIRQLTKTKGLPEGIDYTDYLVNSGNIGTRSEMMTREYEKALASRLSSEAELAKIPGEYKDSFIKSAIEGLVDKERKIGVPGSDSAEIIRLAQKYERQGLTMTEINRVKQLYERNVKMDFFKNRGADLGDNINRANRIDQGIRDFQFGLADRFGYKNIGEINKQTQLAKAVANALYKKGIKDKTKGGLDLFDAVLLSGGDISSLAMAGARRLFGSEGVQAGIAKRLAGKGEKALKKPVVETPKDYFLNAPKAGTPKKSVPNPRPSGPTLFTSPKGKTSPNMQEAVDIASVDLSKAKKPKAGVGQARQKKVKEAMEGNQPFVNPNTLPIVKMGAKPKIKDAYADLPVIQYGKNKEGGFSTTKALGVGGGAAAVGAGGPKLLDMYKNAGTVTYEAPKTARAEEKARPDLKKAFVHTENRGARDSGENLYEVRGVTGDLGKYQVKPETLKDWSKAWLGKTYTPEQFLNDPEAQEEFMDQFLAIVDAYELSPQDAAIVWHKGWGVLGDNKSREEKKKALRRHIDSKRGEAAGYVSTFMEGLSR